MRDFVMGAAFLGLALFALPGTAQDHPNLSGTWQFDSSKSDQHSARVSNATWVIDESDNSIHITESESGKKIELKCSTDGKDCQIAGEKAKASFWYNGPMLVSMETQHNGGSVIRQRLKLSKDSKELTVEISSLVPQSDKSDRLVLAKQ